MSLPDYFEQGSYRYLLTRTLPDVPLAFSKERTLLYIMLNPSTADDTVDDPTIRRCVGQARAWDFNRIRVVNLFAQRATNPKDLEPVSSVGMHNDSIMHRVLDEVDMVVAAWGNPVGKFRKQMKIDFGIQVASTIRTVTERMDLYCLEVLRSGQPKHPLYCRRKERGLLYQRKRVESVLV